jgi:hypothetical protein
MGKISLNSHNKIFLGWIFGLWIAFPWPFYWWFWILIITFYINLLIDKCLIDKKSLNKNPNS